MFFPLMPTTIRYDRRDEVNQEDSEQNEADGMKKGADCHMGTSCASRHL